MRQLLKCPFDGSTLENELHLNFLCHNFSERSASECSFCAIIILQDNKKYICGKSSFHISCPVIRSYNSAKAIEHNLHVRHSLRQFHPLEHWARVNCNQCIDCNVCLRKYHFCAIIIIQENKTDICGPKSFHIFLSDR